MNECRTDLMNREAERGPERHSSRVPAGAPIVSSPGITLARPLLLLEHGHGVATDSRHGRSHGNAPPDVRTHARPSARLLARSSVLCSSTEGPSVAAVSCCWGSERSAAAFCALAPSRRRCPPNVRHCGRKRHSRPRARLRSRPLVRGASPVDSPVPDSRLCPLRLPRQRLTPAPTPFGPSTVLPFLYRTVVTPRAGARPPSPFYSAALGPVARALTPETSVLLCRLATSARRSATAARSFSALSAPASTSASASASAPAPSLVAACGRHLAERAPVTPASPPPDVETDGRRSARTRSPLFALRHARTR